MPSNVPASPEPTSRWWGKLASWAGSMREAVADTLDPSAPVVRPLRTMQATQEQRIHQVQFTYALIALAAKVAAADGPIAREEFLAFCDVFPMPQRRSHKVRQLFFDASFTHDDALVHVRQIVEMFPQRDDLYQEVLERLLTIALADGPLGSEELTLLKNISNAFGVAFFALQRLIVAAQRKDKGNPHAILGIDENATESETKKRYHQLLRDYHPDALAAHGAHPDEYEYYARKTADVNVAYTTIAKARGWK